MPLRRWLLYLCLLGFSAAWGGVNINLASETELQRLNGIGPAKAQAIVAYRLRYGAFHRAEDIQQVKGVGPALYQRIQNDINVNAQTLAPPVGPRSTLPRPALKRITPIN
ncbi:MAG: ComEA family DNA-binding protein [Neisseriaceae bacterium]|nr:ComEA family DNA-binding protein [Neisseriaceae bacterium]MBP6862070.1 ComEA family DNA-binding protein [Neisseriaceae bacterium]